MSSSQDKLSLRYAVEYLETTTNPQRKPIGPTWKEILEEEPFEGQHWEGVYGLPPGSTIEGWETKSLESTPPLSPLAYDDRILGMHSISSTGSLDVEELDVGPSIREQSNPDFLIPMSYDHHQDVETLRALQYWRKGWKTDAPVEKGFTIGDPSTLGVIFSPRPCATLLSEQT